MRCAIVLASLSLAATAAGLGTPTKKDNVNRAAPEASLCTQYAYHADNGYEILNNLWGIDAASGGSQCTYYNGRVGSGVAFSSDWTWTGNENNVKSYIYANRLFTRPLVSEIKGLPTTVDWSYNTTDMRANVAYDIFTDPDPEHPNYSGEYELMIWLNLYGGIWPITESPTGDPVETVTIAGYSWDLYTGWNGDMRVYSFLPADGPVNSFSADVLEFFDFLSDNYDYPASSQYMLIYNFGTEAFTGGPAHFDVSQSQADVQV